MLAATVTIIRRHPITKKSIVTIRVQNEKKDIVQHDLYLAVASPKKPVIMDIALRPMIPQNTAILIFETV